MTVYQTLKSLAAEAGDCELAAQHLRCDLVLAPNVKDSSKVRDVFLGSAARLTPGMK